ncbi:hypothetical protein CASFOL_017708 [Castilleja foliolosa]|uniref:Uncharacterized protein n=1 Tax=Castilleja foliolosa TaxID=1961234 RepID=A0ABD3D8K6_9LAMI
MAFVRCFMFVLLLIVLSISYNGEARTLTQNSSPLEENKIMNDPLRNELLLPASRICALYGSCEQSSTPSKSTNHLMAKNINGEKDSVMMSNNHLGDEKIPPAVICSLIGGC